MATTFRSGPRDPVTGRSSAQISSGNIVRDPNTGQPAQIGVTRQEEAAQRAAPVAQSIPSGALNFQDFLSSTGRSESDPYGSSKGFVGSALGKLGTLDYRNNLSSGIISALNQQAYDKYLNPQRDGQIRSFRPGDLAFIDGRTQQAVRAPSTAEGIMRFMPTTRMLQGLFNPSVEFEPVGQGPATRGSRRPPSALGPTSALQPGEAAPSGFILTSAQPRDNRSLLDVEGFIENLPRTGIGRFFDPVQKKFKAGPGIFGLEFDSNKRQVGVNYKIPISTAGANTQSAPVAESLFAQDLRGRVDDFSKGNPLDALIAQQRMNKMLQMGDETGVYMNPVTLMDQADKTNMGVFLESRNPTTGEEMPILRPEDIYERTIKAAPKFKSINELEENRLLLDDLNKRGQLFYGV